MASKKILVQEDFVHVSSGSNPAAGFLAFYPKSDNNFYLRTSAGVERRLLTSDDSGQFVPYTGASANVNLGAYNLSSRFVSAGAFVDGSMNTSLTGSTSVLIHPSFNGLGYLTYRGGDVEVMIDGYPVKLSQAEKHSLFDGKYQTYLRFNYLSAYQSSFNQDLSYIYGDTVKFDPEGGTNYSIYYCINPSVGNLPTDSNYWLVMSSLPNATFTIRTGVNPVLLFSSSTVATLIISWNTLLGHECGIGIYFRTASQIARYVKIETFNTEWKTLIGGEIVDNPYQQLWRYNAGANTTFNKIRFTLGTWVLSGATAWCPVCQIVASGVNLGNFEQVALTRDGGALYGHLLPSPTNTVSMGATNYRFYGVYSNLGNFSGQLTSTVPTGTAPFVIASTTVNTNLNADLLDGYHASSFALSSHTHAYLPLSGGAMSNTNLVTNLNADLLDGLHASAFAPASHNHSFAGLSDVALVSPSAGHTLVYNGSAWVNNSQIRSVPGAEYNTIYIRSAESGDDFGDSEMYMTAEEGIYFRTNIGKATAAEASFDRYGIRSSKLMGTGERYLAAGSDGLIKVATVQPTQYWERDAGNFNVSPINPADEVHAWLFKAGAGGILMADGYLETNKAGIYTSYNDMVVSEYYLLNNTFYYANSKLAFNNLTNRLTVSGDIDAGENLLFAGQGTLKAKDGGLLWISGYRLNGVPTYLLNGGYLGQIIFGTINDQGGYSQQGVIYSKATQNHSSSNKGTNLEFWNTPNNTYTPRKVAELRQDGFFDSAYGFAVSGSDGRSGTATILTGCSYNSVTKTLIYTRASVTFSGGIVTNIASMSSLSVPLT